MARRKAKPTEEEKHGFVEGAKTFEDVKVPDFMWNTRGPYAVSVIRERALIDSRDGLKPVQRRILWTMYEDGVLPNKGFVKVARLAGNVLRYHPHGNSSVEAALDRMAQPYSLRVTVIDPKGSFGAHPGDEPAAARYIEARLDNTAVELLEETKFNCVHMVPNFDDTLKEPEVLPVRWPVGVINGGSGIAVGYAANMPQHNPTETLKACKLLLKNPDATIEQLMRVMPGPDFWTGGVVYGVDGIKSYYETGRGSFIVRGKYNLEIKERGRTRITFYELPPFVSCESVVEAIRKLIGGDNQLFKGIGRVDDLTGRVNENDVRLVIETKAGANAKAILAELFKRTPLQQSFSVNNTVVEKGRPVTLGVKDLLLQFLDLREECVTTRSKNLISIKEKRVHQINGLLAIILDIDKAIGIIRRSPDVDTARQRLMRSFKIDEEQANYVLSMQLRRLTKQDSTELKAEEKQLESEIRELNKIVNDKDVLHAVIADELDKQIKIIGDERKMEIARGVTLEDAKAIDKRDAATVRGESKDVPTYVTVSADGTVCRTSDKLTPAGSAERGVNGQPTAYSFTTTSKAGLVVIGSDGVAYAAPVSYLTDGAKTTLKKLGVTPRGVEGLFIAPDSPDRKVALFSRNGKMRVVKVSVGNAESKPFAQLDKGDELAAAVDVTEAVKNSTLVVVTEQGQVLRFAVDAVAPVNPGAKLVAGMNLKAGDAVAAVALARPDAKELVTVTGHTAKVTPLSQIPIAGRGGKGVNLQNVIGSDKVTGAMADAKLTNGGKLLPLPKPTARTGRTAPLPLKAMLTL